MFKILQCSVVHCEQGSYIILHKSQV